MAKDRYSTRSFLESTLEMSRKEAQALRAQNPGSILLAVVYAVGISALLFGLHPKFIYLTPLNLLFSFAVVLWQHQNWSGRTVVALLLCFALGLGVEMLGVSTGLVFGEYSYGEVLGPKIYGTPWVIGLNWAMLVYCAAAVTNQLSPKLPLLAKALLGSLLLVSLDILIEPVAIMQGFWSWGGLGQIPLQNYIAWGLIAFVLLTAFHLLQPHLRNKAAFTLLILQFVFFFLLGIDW